MTKKAYFHLKPAKFQSRESKSKTFKSSALIMHHSTARTTQRATKKRAICYATYTANDCGRNIFFISFFPFCYFTWKHCGEKIFLGLVSCQLSNAQDDIIWKRPEKYIFVRKKKFLFHVEPQRASSNCFVTIFYLWEFSRLYSVLRWTTLGDIVAEKSRESRSKTHPNALHALTT